MKTIVDIGKHTKLVLENEKDEKDFRRMLGCEILLIPVLMVVGFMLSMFVMFLICKLLE